MLPRVTLGTMRLDSKPREHRAIVELLERAGAVGIDALHSSFDYPSFRMLCAALCELPGRRFRHIVKVPSPDFGDHRVAAAGFVARIDAYRRALGVERLEMVQWMARVEGEGPSHAEYRGMLDAVLDAAAGAVATGSIASVAVFPYDAGQLAAVQDDPRVDALSLYWGVAERPLEPGGDKPIVALRPLLAALARGDPPETAIRWLCGQGRVSTSIISCSRAEQLEALADALLSEGAGD